MSVLTSGLKRALANWAFNARPTVIRNRVNRCERASVSVISMATIRSWAASAAGQMTRGVAAPWMRRLARWGQQRSVTLQ